MIYVSMIITVFISDSIKRANPVYDYLYCSNFNASKANGVPIWNATSEGLPITGSADYPAAKLDNVIHVNYAKVVSLRATARLGASLIGNNHPCSYWLGEDIPRDKHSMYDVPTSASGLKLRDSTFSSGPKDGWFSALTEEAISGNPDVLTLLAFQGLQQRAWSLYSHDPNVDFRLVGSLDETKAMDVHEFASLFDRGSFTPVEDGNLGLLGTIPTRYYVEFKPLQGNKTDVKSLQAIPWYKKIRGGPAQLDSMMGNAIRRAVDDISSVDKDSIQNQEGLNKTASFNYFLEVSDILKNVPYGTIYFREIDHQKKRYSWDMGFGDDFRLETTSKFPKAGIRQLLQLANLDNGILRNSNPQKLGKAQITQGFRIFPNVASSEIKLPFSGLVGSVLYPFGVSFLLPIFVVMLVQDKEKRIMLMMKMNGVQSLPYHIVQYITLYCMFTISTLVFLATGYMHELSFFTITAPSVHFVYFSLWGHNQVALAFFLSTFFNKSRTALVAVFMLVVCCVLTSLAIDYIFLYSDSPKSLYFWPPFAFYRALGNINRATFFLDRTPYVGLSSIKPDDEIYTSLVCLIVEFPIYLLLAMYFSAVLPSEFGIRKPWNFIFTEPLAYIRTIMHRNQPRNTITNNDYESVASFSLDVDETFYEDSDVKTERTRVLSGQHGTKSPLVIKGMRKVYAGRGGIGPKLAVKDVTFAVEEGITFGLLGPNGAGKTTLISMLTGLYETSSGDAWIGGYNLKTQTSEVYKRIGICPQFDILWDDLSVEEHLYFYARLKGISRAQESLAVEQALENVSLLGFEHKLPTQLSGGERRRLSISIALLGSPRVVFLDEPTTGLDPEVRRLIWDIVNRSREGKTIVLTTHSMEEAEALCQRIGIMAKGTLRCMANPLRLKELYGSGYKLFLNTLQEDTGRACAFVESVLPYGWQKVDAFATSTSYEFPCTSGALSVLFNEIEAKKHENGILDWGVGQTTLEEVFIRLISEGDL